MLVPGDVPLVLAMLLAVSVVGGLAYWDGQREAAASLEDFGHEQASLTAAVAAELAASLRSARRDALVVADGTAARLGRDVLSHSYVGARVVATPSPASPGAVTLRVPVADRIVELELPVRGLVEGTSRSEQPGRRVLLLFPPGPAGPESDVASLTDGRSARAAEIARALSAGATSLRLSRQESAALGLPARTAIAGLASVEEGGLGRWGVAVVATAASERDRESHALTRLVLSVSLAGGIVFAFGWIARTRQRKELELSRELELAHLAQERDERLVRAGRAATMGTLAMGVAHEISTPLGVIMGRTEQLLARVGDDERARRGLSAIEEQATRIGQIVRGFLDLARGGKPAITTVPPETLVRGAVRLVEHRFAAAGATLVTDVPPDVPRVACDIRLIEHALVNLLLNACQACEGGGHVELAVRAAGRTIAFVVTDDGVGISEADAARATEPFFTTKAPGDGTGLGLAIAQEIAKSHRGELSIAPRAPRGTRAVLEIPTEPEEQGDV